MDHHGATGPSLPARWWGPATTVASADVMNQLCRVCGEPAAGFHFGAFTCEGCKSFFGRTYNNLSSVSECKNNGECVINKKNRTSCKACRLRKCLLVGMSKSGSRYGRRSNWFKIHCLLQEQQLQQQHHQQTQVGQQTKKPWEYGKTTALLDIDNNTSSEPTSESPPFTVPHAMSIKTPDSPFWSARSTPFTVPHPYFISPFLQNPLQPVSHNYLLPFLPIRPPLPLEPLVITSPPSSVQSSPNSAITSKKERVVEENDNSLEKLKSLGPVQEQPIDLSSANAIRNSDDESDHTSSPSSPPKNTSPEIRQSVQFEKADVISKSVAPLDLTCSKS